MTTVIDHAIMIPAAQKSIWAIISNIEENPKWVADCEHVSFLTSKRIGTGTRWRSTDGGGRDRIFEITAWYEGLGYEFIVVDGVPYQGENRGRVRLQETPDGTVVQWTFSYELKGFLSGLRNSLSVKKTVDTDVVNSLRNLFAYIKTFSDADISELTSKSLMREAPDVDARSSYQPRYPTALDTGEISKLIDNVSDVEQVTGLNVSAFQQQADAEPVPEPAIAEPPLKDDDTRPNPAVADVDESDVAAPDEDQRFAPPADYQPADAVQSSGSEQSITAEAEEDAESVEGSDTEEQTVRDRELLLNQLQENPFEQQAQTDTPAQQDEATSGEDEPAVSPESQDEAAPTPDEAVTEQPNKVTEEFPASPSPGAPDIRDTSQISVFHLFGLQKPSETQEMRVADRMRSAEINAIITDDDAGREGLRITLRRRAAKVRYPGK